MNRKLLPPPSNSKPRLLCLGCTRGLTSRCGHTGGDISTAAVVSWLSWDSLVTSGSLGRWEGSVGLALVGLGTERLWVTELHSTVVDIVSLSHDLDLVIGELR